LSIKLTQHYLSKHILTQSFWQRLSDAIWPPRCAGCGFWHQDLFCDECSQLLELIAPPMCARCGLPFDPLAQTSRCRDCQDNREGAAPAFELVRSVYAFAGPMRPAVHRLKYGGKTALARPLAQLLYDYLQDTAAIPVQEIGVVVPVPLHAWRQWRRGYNQSTLLARELAYLLDLPCAEVLWRRRHTTSQVELSAKQRRQNVEGAFALDADLLQRYNAQHRPILLIDDVCTTSSTLNECARVLRQAGIEKVYGLTLARQL
jgi:ComF family protein